MKVRKGAVTLWVLVSLGMVIVSGCGPVTVETPTPETVVLQATQTAIALAQLEVELKQTQTALAATQTAMALIATPAATPTQAELTATPTPTATPEPTDTPTFGPTDTSTPVPPTPTRTPVLPTSTQVPPAPTPTYCPDLSNVTISSPEGSETRQEELDSPHDYTSPVRVTWAEACRRNMVVQVYHRETLIFPPGDDNRQSPWGVEISLTPSSEPYEIKVWIPGTMTYDSIWVTVVD